MKIIKNGCLRRCNALTEFLYVYEYEIDEFGTSFHTVILKMTGSGSLADDNNRKKNSNVKYVR